MTTINSIFMFGLGYQEIIIIFIILLLLFGGRKIPELMRGFGRGIKEFKEASKDTPEDTSKDASDKMEKNNQ